MAKALICDTNVFFNLGNGQISITDFCGNNEEIYCSPLCILEISAKLYEDYASRKQAAQAILASNAKMLDDPESFVARLFDPKIYSDSTIWYKIVQAIADSNTIEDVRAIVNLDYLYCWWASVEYWYYSQFMSRLKLFVPKFAEWHTKRYLVQDNPKPHPVLNNEVGENLISKKFCPEWIGAVFVTLKQRAMSEVGDDIANSVHEFVQNPYSDAALKLECYCKIYMQYFSELVTDHRMPQENDFADLELFIYSIDSDSIVTTFESRWVKIAENAGLGNRCRLLKNR
jgi:hypothetical protein